MSVAFSIPEGKIFLMGLPACGKTFLGKKLALENNRPFFDLDTIIESVYNKTIAAIFNEYGEKYFRKIEAETLRNYSFPDNAVIALGGGTPCFLNNLEWIQKQGTTVYIETNIDNITERIISQNNTRPLFNNFSPDEIKSALARLLQQREQFYKQADKIWQL
jgi:shikimate kinase